MQQIVDLLVYRFVFQNGLLIFLYSGCRILRVVGHNSTPLSIRTRYSAVPQLYNTGGNLAWYTYLNNNFTGPINSASNVYAIGGTFHLHVEVTGNNYRAFIDGSTVPITQLTTPDNSIGVVALRGGSNQGFDSVCISTGGVAPHDGDLNGDGGADGRDVGMFSAAIIAGSMDPNLLLHADFNGNGVLDPGDVSGFLALLLGQ